MPDYLKQKIKSCDWLTGKLITIGLLLLIPVLIIDTIILTSTYCIITTFLVWIFHRRVKKHPVVIALPYLVSVLTIVGIFSNKSLRWQSQPDQQIAKAIKPEKDAPTSSIKPPKVIIKPCEDSYEVLMSCEPDWAKHAPKLNDKKEAVPQQKTIPKETKPKSQGHNEKRAQKKKWVPYPNTNVLDGFYKRPLIIPESEAYWCYRKGKHPKYTWMPKTSRVPENCFPHVRTPKVNRGSYPN